MNVAPLRSLDPRQVLEARYPGGYAASTGKHTCPPRGLYSYTAHSEALLM